ncbi:MAG: thiol peroxidase [Bacilli bacterium]
MKKIKYSLLLLMLVLVSACSTNKDTATTTTNFEPIETTSTKITSPELPTQITVNGKAIALSSDTLLKTGDTITSTSLVKPTATFDTMEQTSLDDFKGVKVIHIVPSLDTPVCSLQTRQLDEYAKEFKDINFLTISADLPFALHKFTAINDINAMKVLSDFKQNDFALKNKLFMPEYQLATRAIMIVDENNQIVYLEYASEVTNEINVANVINFVRQNYAK